MTSRVVMRVCLRVISLLHEAAVLIEAWRLHDNQAGPHKRSHGQTDVELISTGSGRFKALDCDILQHKWLRFFDGIAERQ